MTAEPRLCEGLSERVYILWTRPGRCTPTTTNLLARWVVADGWKVKIPCKQGYAGAKLPGCDQAYFQHETWALAMKPNSV